MFIVTFGVSRTEMMDMSIPEMVDIIDYWRSLRRENG